MEITATIKTVSSQSSEEGCERQEMTFNGTVTHTGDGCIIKYTENDEELGSVVTTVTAVDNKQAVVIREGAFASEMTVEKGKRHITPYRTPYGDFNMGIFGSRIKLTKNGTETILSLAYTIDFNNGYISENKMDFYIDEK